MDKYEYLLEKGKSDGIEKNVVGAIIVNEEEKILIMSRKIDDFMGGIDEFDYKSGSGKNARQYNFVVKVKNTKNIILTEHDAYSWNSVEDVLQNTKITQEVKNVVEKYVKIKNSTENY